jgi:hypothetical protein
MDGATAQWGATGRAAVSSAGLPCELHGFEKMHTNM